MRRPHSPTFQQSMTKIRARGAVATSKGTSSYSQLVTQSMVVSKPQILYCPCCIGQRSQSCQQGYSAD